MKLGKIQLYNVFDNQALMSPLEAIENYKGQAMGGITVKSYENYDDNPDLKTLDTKLNNLIILTSKKNFLGGEIVDPFFKLSRISQLVGKLMTHQKIGHRFPH